MDVTLATAEQVRTALNGLNRKATIGDSADVESRIAEEDAYIRIGWGEHPTEAADPKEFYARRQALIRLVGLWFSGNASPIARAQATAFITYRESE